MTDLPFHRLKLYGRTGGTRMAMEIAGHTTEAMHAHNAGGADPKQKLAAARAAFGELHAIKGGADELKNGGTSEVETGTQTGTPALDGLGGDSK